MNMVKNMALMAMGSMMTLAYQKYNKPVMKAMKKAFNKSSQVASKASNTLEQMM
ncbi:MAG TPA: hypothetical protein IAB27_04545 [Candidatus Coprosoma intestinipullorum]|uniref:Uncharacterized protein n=1 Tax=Candidatus Coprosoma intestinipullorum TaxID=2840752 RepID=A0A9D1CYR2_9FIRM|nr:hypothetical protein [Candidatus Coprosoma intestinipullorum]